MKLLIAIIGFIGLFIIIKKIKKKEKPVYKDKTIKDFKRWHK